MQIPGDRAEGRRKGLQEEWACLVEKRQRVGAPPWGLKSPRSMPSAFAGVRMGGRSHWNILSRGGDGLIMSELRTHSHIDDNPGLNMAQSYSHRIVIHQMWQLNIAAREGSIAVTI